MQRHSHWVIILLVLGTFTSFGCATSRSTLKDEPEKTSPDHEKLTQSEMGGEKTTPIENVKNPSRHPGGDFAENSADYHFAMAQGYVAEGNSDRAIEEYKLALIYDPNSALIYTRLAAEFVKKGMMTDAIESCQKAIGADSKNTDARMLLAGLYSAIREHEKAEAEYTKVLTLKPSQEEAAVFRAQVQAEGGKLAEAVKGLKAFLKQQPESVLGFYYLGRIEQQQDHHAEAIVAYKKSLSLRPNFSQAALALGAIYEERQNNKEAKEVYAEIYDSNQDVSAANRLATIYLKEEKFKEALPYLQAVTVQDEDDLNARVKLGLVQMEMKQFPEAIKTFEQILSKNPDSDRIHYYLGSLYEEIKEKDKAIYHLGKITPDSKLYNDAAIHVGYLYKQDKKLDEAKTFINQSIEKSPKSVNLRLFSASLEEEMGNIDGSIRVLEQTVEKFPEEEKPRYYLGSLYDKQGKVEKGLEQMETILKINPNNADALNYLGYTWTLQGVRLGDAEKVLKKAVGLKPENPYIQDSWGWHLFTRGRYNEAVVQLERAAVLKPDESTILEHLADAYLKLNLHDKAFAKYQDALKVASDKDSQSKIKNKLDNLKTEFARSNQPIQYLKDEDPVKKEEKNRAPASVESPKKD